jgi:hypothetical protein
VVIARSPHKFKNVKSTTSVIEVQLDEEDKLKEAFTGCNGIISALGDNRKKRPKAHKLPHVWNAMKAAGVTKYIGMGSGAMMMPGEKRGGFQRTVLPLLCVLKFFGVDLLEQNEWLHNFGHQTMLLVASQKEHIRRKIAWLANKTCYTFFQMACMRLKNQMDQCGDFKNLQIL